MQQIHIYKRHYQNNYHDHIQTLEATFFLDSAIYQYLENTWYDQRFNDLYEYEVQVERYEYEELIQADDTGILEPILHHLLEDEDCYLAIY